MRASSMALPTKKRDITDAMEDSRNWDDFNFRDGDIVIDTYGKTGTTLVQQIVAQLIFAGSDEIYGPNISPIVEMRMLPRDSLLGMLEAQTHRRFLKTHLPVEALVFSPKARYIYIGRDARDVIWSMHNMHVNYTPAAYAMFNAHDPGDPPLKPPPADVRTYYLEWLATGALPGMRRGGVSLWSHVQGWWDVRHLPNVLHESNTNSNTWSGVKTWLQ